MKDSITSFSQETGHVVMLLNNPCLNDSRVIKSAEALAQGGWRVTVLCRQGQSLPLTEHKAGVTYQRIQPIPNEFRSIFARLKQSLFGISKQSSNRNPSLNPKVSANFCQKLQNYFNPNSLNTISVNQTWCNYFCELCRKSIGRTKLFLAPVFRRVGRAITWPIRMLYWYNETDELKSIAMRYAIELNPDVVHCHDLATLPAGVAIAKVSKSMLIYDSHELEMHRNATYPKAVEKKRRKLEKACIVKTDAVITVSESIADHLKADYKIARPYVVMNAPDFENGLEVKRNVRDELGISTNTPLAVYVGSVTINRGIDYVIKALPFFPDLHFATVGPRRAATHAELHELAHSLNVADRVHFVDPVDPSEVVGYISSADVSVLPIQNVCLSYYYCMPNKLLESVFAGIPVAVADLVEMRRFVESYQCGLVMDETCPESIAKVLKQIVDDRDHYVLSEQKRLEVNDKYSWSTQADRLRTLYAKLGVNPSKLVKANK